MNRPRKAILSAFVAVLALAACAPGAIAGRIRSDDDDFKMIWIGLKLVLNNGGEIACDATLLGRFHSTTIVKTANLLIARLPLADTREERCIGGPLVFSASTPWVVSYEGYTGMLPSLGNIRVLVLGLEADIYEEGGVACTMRTTSIEPLHLTLELVPRTGVVREVTPGTNFIDLFDTTGTFCDMLNLDGRFEAIGIAEDSTLEALRITLT